MVSALQTTIKLSRKTRKALERLKIMKRESYDSLLNRLIDLYKKWQEEAMSVYDETIKNGKSTAGSAIAIDAADIFKKEGANNGR
jgi:hypothetical protein